MKAKTIAPVQVFTASPPTKQQKFFFVDGRRLREDDVPLVEVHGDPLVDERYQFDGQNYAGLVWAEHNGMVRETRIADGLPIREVEFGFDGQCRSDVRYEDDRVLESWAWNDTGELTGCMVRLTDGDGPPTRHDESVSYRLEAGLVVEERFNRGIRFFYETGEVLLESVDRVTSVLTPDGRVALKEQKREVVEADHEALREHWSRMLWRPNNLLELPFFAWLQSAVEAQEPGARDLVLEVLGHPVPAPVEKAISIVSGQRLHEATEMLEALTHTSMRKPPYAGGIVGTTAQIAEHALLRLSITDDDELAAKQIELRRKHKEDDKAERVIADAEQMLISADWPVASADYETTQTHTLTVRSGADVVNNLAPEGGPQSTPEISYMHQYRFLVGGCEFTATEHSDTESHPSADRHQVRVRYNPTAPQFNKIIPQR